MCGIVGVAGQIGLQEENVFKDLLFLDSLRGEDSTGVLRVMDNATKDTEVFKKAMHAYDFLCLPRTHKLFHGKNLALVGHNRAATQGRITHANAHPFEHSNIIGVHNGTLKTRSTLQDAGRFPVDSDNIFYNIYKEGADATLRKLDGAYALVWWDKERNRLCFGRNKERPLNYCYSNDGKTIFWASEQWMLEGCLARRGVKHTGVEEFPVQRLFEYDLSEKGQLKPHVREVEAYVSPFTLPQNTGAGTNSILGTNELTKLGYHYGKVIQFVPIEVVGNCEVMCCTDDKHMAPVLFYVADKERAQHYVDNCFLLEATVSGYQSPFKGTVRGALRVVGREVKIVEDVTSKKEVGKASKSKKYSDFKGKKLSREDWRKQYKDCMSCGDPLDPDIDDGIVIVGNTSAVCGHCVEDFETNSQRNFHC